MGSAKVKSDTRTEAEADTLRPIEMSHACAHTKTSCFSFSFSIFFRFFKFQYYFIFSWQSVFIHQTLSLLSRVKPSFVPSNKRLKKTDIRLTEMRHLSTFNDLLHCSLFIVKFVRFLQFFLCRLTWIFRWKFMGQYTTGYAGGVVVTSSAGEIGDLSSNSSGNSYIPSCTNTLLKCMAILAKLCVK